MRALSPGGSTSRAANLARSASVPVGALRSLVGPMPTVDIIGDRAAFAATTC
ncbi:hypothetical protein [Streptomyces sp. SID12501]|uniref:Uncharacterized protein n=1 Tax=Streptomyces sp. SID12501 TaxID=2706042 RepID=A0A6B3BNH5_9ACTN|nr:hypothetical protein [Streptomyces sp. SID12501]NEC85043.1 hypothetical protein [Streptomyces sp. SID12501]